MAPAPPPKSPDEWIAVAERELENLRKAYEAKQSNDIKIDHALKAVEAALKAVIWKANGWTEWPKRKDKPELYQHDIDIMLRKNLPNSVLFPLRQDVKTWGSWRVLANTSLQQSRYMPNPPSDDEANEIARCSRHWDWGVTRWLLRFYQKMS